MAHFTRHNAAAARAYLARRLASGKLAAPQARGHGKPPAQYTDAYAVRLANAQVRGQGRQAGRGHAATREHPRQFTIDYVGGKGIRRPSGRIEPDGSRQFRLYQNPAALLAWMHDRLPAGTYTRVAALGIVRETYTALTLTAVDRTIARSEPGERAGMTDAQRLEAEAALLREWRSIYTGDSSGAMDLNDVTMVDLADLWAAVNRVFVPGTVKSFQLNWH
jgi:hypothetical protein